MDIEQYRTLRTVRTYIIEYLRETSNLETRKLGVLLRFLVGFRHLDSISDENRTQ